LLRFAVATTIMGMPDAEDKLTPARAEDLRACIAYR
jgi:hypothetical protein